MLFPEPAKPRGTLVALGGHDDRAAERALLRRALARHAPEARRYEALHVGGPAPASPPDADGPAAPRLCEVRARADAEDPALVTRVEAADVLHLSGTHALRLTNLLGGSPLLAALCRAYARGALVLATGAGAAALSGTMMLRADPAREEGAVLATPGLGLLPNAILDTRFAARGRLHGVLEMVTRNPGHVALGLGQGAAVVVREGDSVEAVGPGSVVVVDGHDLGHSNLTTRPRGRPVAMEHLVVHVLVEGYRYDLASRRYLPPEPERPAPRTPLALA